MDGYLCLLHLTTGVVLETVFIPFATAAFFTFILVSIFGMRYLLVVWRIQRPESIRATPAERQQQQEQQQQEQQEQQEQQQRQQQQEPDYNVSSESLLPTANVIRPNTTTNTNNATTTEETSPYREVTYLYYRLCEFFLLFFFILM